MSETLTAPVAETNRVNQVPITDDVLNVADFNSRIVGAYNDGTAELGLPADIGTLRSFIPAGTGILRDFSYIAPEIPLLNSENCVACMACVIECPDTAILGKVVPQVEARSGARPDSRRSRARALSQAVRQDDQVLERL
jgi:ferredoxin